MCHYILNVRLHRKWLIIMNDNDLVLLLASEAIGDELSKSESDGGGCGLIVGAFLMFMVGFSVFVISGISWSSLWQFVKVISLPISFDYQLFGWNHYASTAISAGMLFVAFSLIYIERFYNNFLYIPLTTTKLNKFFLYRLLLTIGSALYDLFIGLFTYITVIWIIKFMLHGFMAFWVFIFSIQ